MDCAFIYLELNFSICNVKGHSGSGDHVVLEYDDYYPIAKARYGRGWLDLKHQPGKDQGVATLPSNSSGCLNCFKALANEQLERKDLPIRLGSAVETLLAGVLSGLWSKVRV